MLFYSSYCSWCIFLSSYLEVSTCGPHRQAASKLKLKRVNSNSLFGISIALQVIIFLLYSFWVPQIVVNAVKGTVSRSIAPTWWA